MTEIEDDFGDGSITRMRQARKEAVALLTGHPEALMYVESLEAKLEDAHKRLRSSSREAVRGMQPAARQAVPPKIRPGQVPTPPPPRKVRGEVMSTWLIKRRQRIALNCLYDVAGYTQARIDAGDLDFDDVIYRGRDAALTLLDVFEYLDRGGKA